MKPITVLDKPASGRTVRRTDAGFEVEDRAVFYSRAGTFMEAWKSASESLPKVFRLKPDAVTEFRTDAIEPTLFRSVCRIVAGPIAPDSPTPAKLESGGEWTVDLAVSVPRWLQWWYRLRGGPVWPLALKIA
jgi:hypothetical protein